MYCLDTICGIILIMIFIEKVIFPIIGYSFNKLAEYSESQKNKS